MKKSFKRCCAAGLLILGAGLGHGVLAQDKDVAGKDPARWYSEDMTVQARQQTLRKEAGAAFKEAQLECRRMAAADRSACNREARANYDADLAAARALTAR